MVDDTAKADTTKDKKTTSDLSKMDIPTDRLGVENGADGSMPFSTPFNMAFNGIQKSPDEELQEVVRYDSEEWGPTVRQLVAMRRMDGQARALYRLITLPIRAALSQATFLPADGGEKEAEFIEQVFTTAPQNGGMTTTFHRFMSQVLQGLFDGFSAFEKVFWVPDDGPLKGKITLKKLAHRPAESVTFIADKKGGFAGLRQRTLEAGKAIDVYIPSEYSFYYCAQEEERKFYGISYFQAAFYHYDKKAKLYWTAHLAAQRAAVGTRIGTFPTNTPRAIRQDFARQLSNLSLAQWIAIPEGFKVDVLKEGGAANFLELINHHNSQMSKSILANFFDKDQGAGPNEGSLVNFAAPGDSMFLLMLRAIMDDIANSINHYIIPQLVDLNFDGGLYPKFTWGKLTDEQKAAVSSTFDKLAAAGQQVNTTPEFLRALEELVAKDMGLDIDYDEIAKREAEEKAKADAQAQMLAGGGAPGDPNADPNAAPGAPGAPASPPGVNPASDAAAMASFQATLAAGSTVDPKNDQMALSNDTRDELFGMAQDLLDSAREQVGLSRTVRTDKGERKFRKPIGSEISPQAVAGGSHEVTLVRLRSLQDQIKAARDTGDVGLLRMRLREFNREVRQWQANRSALTVAGGLQAKGKLPPKPTPPSAPTSAVRQ